MHDIICAYIPVTKVILRLLEEKCHNSDRFQYDRIFHIYTDSLGDLYPTLFIRHLNHA